MAKVIWISAITQLVYGKFPQPMTTQGQGYPGAQLTW